MRKYLFPAGLVASFALLVWGTWQAFFVAPVESKMGYVQKIFYYHVPSAWILFLAVFISAGASVVYLIRRSDAADRAAYAAAELAAVFGAMVLVTGPLWGWKAWGKPWVWDVRLTSSLLLWMVILAYLAVRAFAGAGARTLAAGLSIFSVVQVPLIYYAVDLWRGTHPERLVAKGALDPQMRAALYTCTFGFLLLFAVLYAARLRLGRAQARLDELWLRVEDLEQ